MDIDRTLRNMNKESRDYVKQNLEMYQKTGRREYAQNVLDTLKNFSDESAVKEIKRILGK